MGRFISFGSSARSLSRPDITEFHICPPADPLFEHRDCLDRLEAHMRERFPRFTFRASHEIPFRHHGEFVLLPMTDCVGVDNAAPGERQLMPAPDAELITALYRALGEFDPRAGPRRMN